MSVNGWRSLVAVALLSVASLAAPGRAGELAEDRAPPSRAPVSVRGEVLFEIQAPTGRLEVPDRAARIAERVAAAVRQGRTGADVRAESRAGAVDVWAGPDFVFSVWDEDAARAGVPLSALAAARADALRRALDAAHAETEPGALLRAAARAAVATAALVIFLVALRLVIRRARVRTAHLARSRLRILRRRGVPGLSALRVGRLVRGAIGLTGLAAGLFAVVAWLEYVLERLPWTRGPARSAVRFVWEAVGSVASSVVAYLPSAFYILLFVVLARLVLRVVHAAFRELELGRVVIAGFHADWARPTYNLVRVLVLAVTAVAIFPYLPGSGSSAFQSVSIFVGVLVSLGSTSAVANGVAGVILTYMRPFLVGDRIRSGEVEGMVVAKNLLMVRLRTDKNEEVTIPNATVLGSHVKNYSAMARREGLLVHTEVTLGYAVPWRQIDALLVAAATGSEGIAPHPPPFVLQTALDDFYVRYELNAYCRAPERLPWILACLHARIQDQFAEAGIEIMSPHYTALRDGHDLAFPEAYHPVGARPGRLRVEAVEGPRAPERNTVVAPSGPSPERRER